MLSKFAIKDTSMKKITTFLSLLTSLCLTSCQSVTPNNTASLLNGTYSDPNHPNGTRQVIAHKDHLTIKGRDEKNGSLWVINGDIQGNTIILDFSSKGGPASITATYDNQGITFSDGNTWVKKPRHDKSV